MRDRSVTLRTLNKGQFWFRHIRLKRDAPVKGRLSLALHKENSSAVNSRRWTSIFFGGVGGSSSTGPTLEYSRLLTCLEGAEHWYIGRYVPVKAIHRQNGTTSGSWCGDKMGKQKRSRVQMAQGTTDVNLTQIVSALGAEWWVRADHKVVRHTAASCHLNFFPDVYPCSRRHKEEEITAVEACIVAKPCLCNTFSRSSSVLYNDLSHSSQQSWWLSHGYNANVFCLEVIRLLRVKVTMTFLFCCQIQQEAILSLCLSGKCCLSYRHAEIIGKMVIPA